MADQGQGESGYGLEPQATPAASPPPPRVPAHMQMSLKDRDVACRRCGFNLRGLTADRNCPECGTPIWMTLEGDPLLYSSPEYLRTLSHGLAWILIASLCYFALLLATVAFSFMIAVTDRSSTLLRGGVADAINLLVDVPLSAALLYGWWMFSTPDVGIIVGNRGDRPRLVVRWASIVYLGISLLASLGFLIAVQAMSPAAADEMFGIAHFVAGIAALVQFFGSLVYIQWIAKRMQNAPLAEQAQRYLWLLPLIFILGACVLFIGPLVAWVLYLLLLNEVRKGIIDIMERQNRELAAMTQTM